MSSATYTSTINFTLDTICPWTYIAKRRLSKALSEIRARHPPVEFKLHFHPYQLFDDAPATGEDKYEWYKNNKYDGSEDRMKKFTTLMKAYGVAEGINFSFGGQVASTLEAHRVLQVFQERKGAEVVDAMIDSLYFQYFEDERHPSARETLLKACKDAGVDDEEAKTVIDDQSDGVQEVRMLIREQAGNGVDSVPTILIEGRRRDFTLVGAKEVAEYVKTLEQVIKEAS